MIRLMQSIVESCYHTDSLLFYTRVCVALHDCTLDDATNSLAKLDHRGGLFEPCNPPPPGNAPGHLLLLQFYYLP